MMRKSRKAGLITAYLVFAGVVGLLCYGLLFIKDGLSIRSTIGALMYVLLLAYGVLGYYFPYGNTFKYHLLVFAFLLVSYSCLLENAFLGLRLMLGYVAIVITYMGGRLNKLDQNRLLMALIGLALVAVLVYVFIFMGQDFLLHIDYLSIFIAWLLLCYAYLVRFREHELYGIQKKK